MSDVPLTVRKLARLLRDILTANKKAKIVINVVPGNAKSPFIEVTNLPDIADLEE